MGLVQLFQNIDKDGVSVSVQGGFPNSVANTQLLVHCLSFGAYLPLHSLVYRLQRLEGPFDQFGENSHKVHCRESW